MAELNEGGCGSSPTGKVVMVSPAGVSIPLAAEELSKPANGLPNGSTRMEGNSPQDIYRGSWKEKKCPVLT